MKFERSRAREKDEEQVTITCRKYIEICHVTKEVAYQYTHPLQAVMDSKHLGHYDQIRIVKATFEHLN